MVTADRWIAAPSSLPWRNCSWCRDRVALLAVAVFEMIVPAAVDSTLTTSVNTCVAPLASVPRVEGDGAGSADGRRRARPARRRGERDERRVRRHRIRQADVGRVARARVDDRDGVSEIGPGDDAKRCVLGDADVGRLRGEVRGAEEDE